MQNEANWAILDSFDITLIEIIQDTMERQEKALQLSCFEV